MSTPRLYTVFEYVAALIAERDPNEPFMLSQLQPALHYKFPDFTFESYQLSGLKDFILAGEKAGYFKLVNTGNIQTAVLQAGSKQPPPAESEMGKRDPRRTQWMNLTVENMLSSDRADQLIAAMQKVDALTPEFDAYLATSQKNERIYPTRGKIKRIREFLAAYRTKGPAAASATWQPSRAVLRMPTTPPVEGAGQAQTLIWALLQGNTTFAETRLDALDDFFFAVLRFSREQMAHNKSWDWVEGLNILEAEAKAIPRPVPQKKGGLFGGKTQTQTVATGPDEARIATILAQLQQAAGVAQNEIPIWQAYAQTAGMDAALQFLAQHPALLKEDRFVAWLEDQISDGVEAGKMDMVKTLANRAALLLATRQFGAAEVRQQQAEIKAIFESILSGATDLSLAVGFIQAPSVEAALAYFDQHFEMQDEAIGALFSDQMNKAARRNNVPRYRLVSQRYDLWRNLLDFGKEEGLRQHQSHMANGPDDTHVQIEMGMLLMAETNDAEAWQDIISRYPPVATEQGLAAVTYTLDRLSFQRADPEVYNRYHDVKRLIERCLQVGVDRALSELK